jgi:hypothetical protein
MTNEELIKRFLLGRLVRNTESYGIYVLSPWDQHTKQLYAEGSMLFSRSCTYTMATRIRADFFILSIENPEFCIPQWREHFALLTKVARELNVSYVYSPHANKAYFQEHMEKEINKNLYGLATDLRTGNYKSVAKYIAVDNPYPKPKTSFGSVDEICYVVPENYQKLMENILILLNGEIKLGLPKNQVSLIDDDEFQSMWRWLIKENPVKEDRELLRKTYMLSRLMAPHQKMAHGGLIPMPK